MQTTCVFCGAPIDDETTSFPCPAPDQIDLDTGMVTADCDRACAECADRVMQSNVEDFSDGGLDNPANVDPNEDEQYSDYVPEDRALLRYMR